MTLLTMVVVVGAGSFVAGLLGSLTGLGGGIVIVPMLTLLLHVNLRYAIGASLVCVIATSSGAAAAYVREGYTNIRIGIFLEIATTIGAVVGAAVAGFVPTRGLAILFGAVLLYTAYRNLQAREEHSTAAASDKWGTRLRLGGTYPTPSGMQRYSVQGVPAGFALMLAAGLLSALLGIGSGVVKVLAMDRTMRLPFKVSTTTSNFMIGVTAAASAGIYLGRGYIDPTLTFPVVIGVVAGASIGARILAVARVDWLRKLFTAVIVVLGIQMLYKGATGGL